MSGITYYRYKPDAYSGLAKIALSGVVPAYIKMQVNDTTQKVYQGIMSGEVIARYDGGGSGGDMGHQTIFQFDWSAGVNQAGNNLIVNGWGGNDLYSGIIVGHYYKFAFESRGTITDPTLYVELYDLGTDKSTNTLLGSASANLFSSSGSTYSSYSYMMLGTEYAGAAEFGTPNDWAYDKATWIRIGDTTLRLSDSDGWISTPVTTGITNSKVVIEEGGSGAGKYSLLERVRDDNGNEIGTVGTFFTDANGTEYAVVVLDAKDRAISANWASNEGEVTDLPLLSSATSVFANKDTATYNTQKILDWCNANGYTSGACSHCRGKSFTIDGTTYYGQLPNRAELLDLLTNYVAIDTADSSTGQTLAALLTSNSVWSSSQCYSLYAWNVPAGGTVNFNNKMTLEGVVPVLEIPNR